MAAKAEIFGPAHFNAIINTQVEFFGADGDVQTSLFEAAQMAEASAAALLGRVKVHYSRSNLDEFENEQAHYGKLQALVEAIRTAVAALGVDEAALDEGGEVEEAARIKVAGDIVEVKAELQAVAKRIETNFLTGGSRMWFNWYLPDYMAALEELKAAQDRA